jgi:type VI protein secretion system component Hcp
MKTALRFVVPAAVAVGLLGLTAARRTDAPAMAGGMTLSIAGVHGGAVPASTVDAFEWSVSTTAASARSAGAGRPTYGDLVVTIPLDQTAPVLAAGAAAGKNFATATLTIGNQGSIKLSEVRISSLKWMSSPSGPVAQLSLAYAKIEWDWGGKHSAADLMRGVVN